MSGEKAKERMGAARVAQVVGHLLSKREALSSKPRIAKKRKNWNLDLGITHRW
jgi:hypothetical protein